MLKYYYTKYGDVYAGYEFQDTNYPDYTIVIQGTKKAEFNKLKPEEKTLEKISEYGWVLGNNVIQGIVNSNELKKIDKINPSTIWHGDYERKVMFLFGAGASANCVYGEEKSDFEKDPLRPPLGTELFDKRFANYANRYKGVKQSLHILQDENHDIEDLFEHEWKNINKENNQTVLSRHINIQYYLQEVQKNVTQQVTEKYSAKNLYAKLAEKLQKINVASVKNIHGRQSFKKFAFVSFNHDTILETFIEKQFKSTISTINDYINVNDSPFCIFKPHGSWNWGWKFPDISKFNDNTAEWLFDNNISFFQLYFRLLGDHINMIDWSTWGTEASLNKHNLGKHCIDKSQIKIIGNDNFNNYFPALHLPYRDKDEFTMPLRHLYNMEAYFSYVETLVIIGWKGNEEAFNRLIFKEGQKINKVIIVDPNPETVEENLKPLLSKLDKNNIKYYNDFEDFVLNGLDIEID